MALNLNSIRTYMAAGAMGRNTAQSGTSAIRKSIMTRSIAKKEADTTAKTVAKTETEKEKQDRQIKEYLDKYDVPKDVTYTLKEDKEKNLWFLEDVSDEKYRPFIQRALETVLKIAIEP